MKTLGIVAAVVVGLLFVVGFFVMSYVNNANYGNAMENRIIAQYEQNQNTLSAFSTSVLESAQVPKMYEEALVNVIRAGLEGRYGPAGSGAFVQAITEAYPGELSPTLYTNIQNAIESGRRNFSAEQAKLLDITRQYKTALGNVWGGFWMGLAGYPKIDLNQYGIVTDARTQDVFRTGTDAPLQIGG